VIRVTLLTGKTGKNWKFVELQSAIYPIANYLEKFLVARRFIGSISSVHTAFLAYTTCGNEKHKTTFLWPADCQITGLIGAIKHPTLFGSTTSEAFEHF
jgi:hypothetical protein